MEVESNESSDEDDRQRELSTMRRRGGRPVFIPTADDIAATSAKIQSRWTDDERYLRLREWRKQ
jgi:hypothetical protein